METLLTDLQPGSSTEIKKYRYMAPQLAFKSKLLPKVMQE